MPKTILRFKVGRQAFISNKAKFVLYLYLLYKLAVNVMNVCVGNKVSLYKT